MADPPWPYGDPLPGKGRGAGTHYGLMDMDAIMNMPIRDLAHPEGSHLYLCVPNAFLADAFVVMRHWGWEYKTLLTWVKTTKAGGVRMGMGRYYRNATEHILFGILGTQKAKRLDELNVLFAERTQHSRKPAELFHKVERISPGPRIELFAREYRSGWDGWGLEYAGAPEDEDS